MISYRTVATILIGLGAVLSCTGKACADPPVFKDDFDAASEGWIALGPHAKAAVTTAEGKAKSGKGALEFTYEIGGKPAEATGGMPPFDALMRATPNGALAKMKSLRFWAKSDGEMPLAIVLTEKDGGRYIASAWIPKGEWQEIVLAPDDFSLTDGKDDPKDPDGKLDLDKVENIAIADPLAIFAPALSASGQGGFSDAGLHIGKHTLWLDDFTVSTEAAPSGAAPEKGTTGLDLFDRDQLRWIALGEVQLKLDKAAPTKTRAMRVDYKQGDGQYVVLIRMLHNLKAAADDNFVIDVAAAKSARLILTLEEQNGAKYSLTLAVPGDSDPINRVLPLSSFALSEGPADDNGKLDLDKVKSLTITDVTGAFGIAKQKNTLWIGPIRFQKK